MSRVVFFVTLKLVGSSVNVFEVFDIIKVKADIQTICSAKVRKRQRTLKIIKSRCLLMKVTVNNDYIKKTKQNKKTKQKRISFCLSYLVKVSAFKMLRVCFLVMVTLMCFVKKFWSRVNQRIFECFMGSV